MSTAEKIITLAAQLAPQGTDEELLGRLCKAAQAELDGMLRSGVTEESCADAFICAAAWLALSSLPQMNLNGVEQFTVGDVHIDCQKGWEQQSEQLRQQALKLMRPYVDDGFAFMGVRA